MTPEISSYFPFVKPSGNMSAQIGPIIKRGYTKAKGGGPSRKILSKMACILWDLTRLILLPEILFEGFMISLMWEEKWQAMNYFFNLIN